MRGSAFRSVRLAAIQLALAAMMLRALIPAGWMPNPQAAAGGTPLVICSMQGLVTIRIDADGTPIKRSPGKDHGQDNGLAHDHDVCPFAAVGHLAPPTLPASLLQQALIASDAFIGAGERPAHSAYLHSSHRPRAPPRLA